MAELRLSAPEPFDLKKPDEWAKWKRRFEQYQQTADRTELQEDSKKNPILVEAEHQQNTSTTPAPSTSQLSSQQFGLCGRCGQERHAPRDRCPAINAICYRCNKIGHFSARCRTRGAAMNEIDELAKAVDSVYLDTVTTHQQRSWYCIIQIGKSVCMFQIIGAEVTAITEEVYQTFQHIQLQKQIKVIHGPTCHYKLWVSLPQHFIVHGQRSTEQIVFVVRGLKNNLLGLPAITSLHLLSRAETIESKINGHCRYWKKI